MILIMFLSWSLLGVIEVTLHGMSVLKEYDLSWTFFFYLFLIGPIGWLIVLIWMGMIVFIEIESFCYSSVVFYRKYIKVIKKD